MLLLASLLAVSFRLLLRREHLNVKRLNVKRLSLNAVVVRVFSDLRLAVHADLAPLADVFRHVLRKFLPRRYVEKVRNPVLAVTSVDRKREAANLYPACSLRK